MITDNSFNSFFFEYLENGEGMEAEIPSPKQGMRRWVFIYVYCKCEESILPVSPNNRFAIGPLHWYFQVFDFDHNQYDFISDKYCGTTMREYVEEFVTTDLEEFKRKLEEYSLNQDMFSYHNPDFPQ